MEERGKRRMARQAAALWALLTAVMVCAIVWGEMDEAALSALVSLYGTATAAVSAIVVGLLGLDAAAAQIIPAWRKQ